MLFKKAEYGKIIWDLDTEGYHHFTDDMEVTKWGERHYQEWSNNYFALMNSAKDTLRGLLTSAPIEYYCGYSYRDMNLFLRTGEDTEGGIYRELSDILIIMMCMAPRVPDNVVVYKLVPNEIVKQIEKFNSEGDVYQEKGFISTGLLSEITKVNEHYNGYKNILKLYVKKGSIGVYVNTITKRNEQELLMFPGGYYKLIKKPYKDPKLNKIVYECELFYFQ